MVAGEGQARHDDLGRPGGRDHPCRQGVAHDAIVHLRKQPAVVKRDARATGAAFLASLAEAHDDIGPAVAGGVLQGHQEATGRRRVVVVIAAAPGVDVDHAVRGDDEVPGVADVVGEHRGTEAGGQRDPTVVIRTGLRRRRGRVAFLGRG